MTALTTERLALLASGFCAFECPRERTAQLGSRAWCLTCRKPIRGGFGGGASNVSLFSGGCPTPGCSHLLGSHGGDGCTVVTHPAYGVDEPKPAPERCPCRRAPMEAELAVEHAKHFCCSPNPLSPRLLCELPKHPPEIDHAAMTEPGDVGHDDGRVVRWHGRARSDDATETSRSRR